eukprot:SAG22_NODE_301_length_12744_cov_19.648189_15_plen_45_part_00
MAWSYCKGWFVIDVFSCARLEDKEATPYFVHRCGAVSTLVGQAF